MRAKILIWMVMMIALVGVVSATNLTCRYDETPNIEYFERIEWLCYFDTNEDADCNSYVEFNDEIIQVNPDETDVDDVGIIDKFVSSNGLVNVYFKNTDLRHDRNVTFGVRCGNITYEAVVTPTYKDPKWMIDRGSWVRENSPYFVMGFFIIVVLLGLLRYLIDKYKHG